VVPGTEPPYLPGPLIELTRKASGVFADRGFDNPRLEAELLLAGVLGIKRLDLYLQHDRPVTEEELERYRSAVRRRLKHEPLQYVLGTAAFRHLELAVDRRVLIPRPETEVLVGAVLEWARTRENLGAALDIGTGSGAIALSLAAEGSFTRVVATDVSQEALAVAQQNAHRIGLGDRVELREGSLFEPLHAGEQFTVIVSNPPYVADTERDTLAPEVREHEPATALFAGNDGLSVIKSLLRDAAQWLETGGLLALEIGATQGDEVMQRARASGHYENVRVLPDLSGRARVVLAERTAARD
jgi:release factor glutamine methyltransferase